MAGIKNMLHVLKIRKLCVKNIKMYYKYVIYVLQMTGRQEIARIVNIFCLADRKKKKSTP